MEDPVGRFSRVVENYRRYRPHYPPEIIAVLNADCHLTPDHLIADVGSGTGLLTELFLKNGNQVYGVEPNAEMRGAAEELLSESPKFVSVDGTAEATTLADQSVHLISVGQAFHWFDHTATRTEFLRILKPGGWVALVWNMMMNDGSAFGNAFMHFWHTFVREGETFQAPQRPTYVTAFFGDEKINEKSLDNTQACDFVSFKGRILSASHSLKEDDPRYPLMLDEIKAIFDEYQVNGVVPVTYDTRLVYGQLSD